MSDDATQAALRDMSRSIGGLESTVKSLVQTWQSQETLASQGRRDLHQKFDALRLDVHSMATQVAGALTDIAALKPSVDAFEDARTEARGAQKLGRRLFAGIGAIGTLIGAALGWALTNYWIAIGPKTPLH
jgi:uncharacterized protein YukE